MTSSTLQASLPLAPFIQGASQVQLPELASHTPFKEQSMSVLQLPTGAIGGPGGVGVGVGAGGCGAGGAGGAGGRGAGGASLLHAHSVHAASWYDAFQCVAYSCAIAPPFQAVLMP